jgi:peptide/nickel transport system permease protein
MNKSIGKSSSVVKPLINRVLTSLLVLFLLVTFVFVLVRIAPGDPSAKYISPKLSPELAKQVQKSFGLEKPITIQYLLFIGSVFTGDFGISYNYRQPVFDVIKKYFLFTFLFATISLLIQVGFALLLTKFSFKHQGKLLDNLLSKSAILIYSIPVFVVGLILVYLFSVKLNILPTSGITSVYNDDMSLWQSLSDNFVHLILPLITLSFAGTAIFFKYLRDNVIAISNQTFVVNLKAGGLAEKDIYKKHILPNAVQPLISVIGIEYGLLLSGALITEVIFSLPGMGRLTVNAIMNRDFPLVIGCTLIAGFLIVITNLVADLIKIKFDKRLIKDLIK